MPTSTASSREGSVFDLLVPLLHRWKLLLGLPIACGALGAALALVLPPSFTAATTFVPAVGGANPSLPSGLAGLATQFGVNVNTGASLSPDFFAEVLDSRELLRATLLSQFDDPQRPASPRTLLDILVVSGKTEGQRLNEGIRRLQTRISQRVDRRTGIVTLEVKGRQPTLAAAVANKMIELLNKFNLERLQSQSRERRRFAEERLHQAEQELRDAEARHLTFLQANRRYSDSPLLSFEENRLSRQVQLHQEVFQTLTREFEAARIAEVRDTPLLTIIDPAVPPDRRSFPPRKLIVVLMVIAGGLSALTLVYLGELQRAAVLQDQGAYRHFLLAWTTTKAELRALLRMGKPG